MGHPRADQVAAACPARHRRFQSRHQKIAITEYNYGGNNHISGAIAQADVLGIFGREGVFAANFWG